MITSLADCIDAAEAELRRRGWHHGEGFHPADVFDAPNEDALVAVLKECPVTPMGAVYAALIGMPSPARAKIGDYVRAQKAIRALAVVSGIVPRGTQSSGSPDVRTGKVPASATVEPQFSAWNAAPERTLEEVLALFSVARVQTRKPAA